jgi:MFS family permease
MEVESISLGTLSNVNKQRSKARFSSLTVKPREALTQVSLNDSVGQPIVEHQGEPTSDPNYDDFPEGGLRANLVVLGALSAVIIVFGNMNTVGVIQAYVSEHILMDSSASTVGWVFSVYFFFSFFGGIYAGPIFDYTGSTIPMYLGSSFIIGGLFATANCHTVWQFILAFGVVVGVGTSFLMNCCISSVSHYFLKRRGTALGVCSLGGAIGGVVWPLLLRELYPRLGFEWAMRIYGFLSCFFLGIGCLLVKNRITKHKGDKKGVALVKDSFVLQDLIKDPAYLFLTLSILLCEFSLVLAITYISSYTIYQGHSEGDAFMVTIVCNAVGIPGRYLPNYLADRYGSMNIMFACVSVCSILILVLWLPFGWNLKCMYAFSGLYGFFSSSTLSLTPVCCGLIGKTEDFGKKYGTVYFLVAFGNLVSLPIGGAIIGNGSGYSNMIIFCGVLEAVAAVLWLMTRYTLVGWKWAKI